MVGRHARSWLPGVVIAGIVGAYLSATGVARSPVRQEQGPSEIPLRGATVVVGNGRVLQNATVVLRGQLIEAVGTQVPLPAGATEIDVQGAFVNGEPASLRTTETDLYEKYSNRPAPPK